MPSHPPDRLTNDLERTLWRDLSRLFEDFQGGEDRFLFVLDLIAAKLQPPLPCYQCGAGTINKAEPPEVDLECPACGWRPVEVVTETIHI